MLTTSKTNSLHCRSICIVAGEASGDVQGALLVRALKKESNHATFWGITGPALREEGVETVCKVEDLSVMGYSEILPKYHVISKNYKKILNEIRKRNPTAVIFIDYPGFNLRLVQDVYNSGITTIYHIPPKAWSHGAHRTSILKNYCYLVTSILPFEFEFFKAKNIPIKFVGNPLKDQVDEFIALHPTNKQPYHIGILPGSRENEIKKLLPTLIEAFLEIHKADNQFVAHIPIASTLPKEFINLLINDIKAKFNLNDSWFEEKIKITYGNAHEVMNFCEYAWVCSGTATLETTFFSTPMCIMYKVSPITYYLAKKFLKIKYVSLVNLCMDSLIVPEFLQDMANPKNLIDHALFLLKNKEAKMKMIAQLEEVKSLFPPHAAQNAAQEIMQCIAKYEMPFSEKFHLHRKNWK